MKKINESYAVDKLYKNLDIMKERVEHGIEI